MSQEQQQQQTDTKPKSYSSPMLDEYKKRALADFQDQFSSLQKQRQDIQDRYMEPAFNLVASHVATKPITTAAIAIFSALAFIPALSFLLFSLATVFIVLGGSIAFGLFWAITFILFGASALLGTLFVTGIVTGFIVFWSLVAFASFRLVATMMQAPSLAQGASAFDAEMRALFTSPSPALQATVKTD